MNAEPMDVIEAVNNNVPQYFSGTELGRKHCADDIAAAARRSGSWGGRAAPAAQPLAPLQAAGSG